MPGRDEHYSRKLDDGISLWADGVGWGLGLGEDALLGSQSNFIKFQVTLCMPSRTW